MDVVSSQRKPDMKSSIIKTFTVAVVSLLLVGTISAFAAEGGKLMVARAANFGERISLTISVDGKEVARLSEGRIYDGPLTPGRHIISATVVPNLVDSPVWKKEITVHSGQSYSFTAIWQGETMVLVSN
jgi:hypothetical protein